MTTRDKRSEILQSALELIALKGFQGATTALIASRANVAAGTVYCYFESKEVLIYALNQEMEKRFLTALMEGYPGDRPLRERFLHVGRTFTGYCLAFPADFQFLEQFHNSPYGAEYRRDRILGDQNQDIIHEVFETARREQIVKDLPKTILMDLFFGPLICIVRGHIFGFNELDEPTIDRIVAACWDAIRL